MTFEPGSVLDAKSIANIYINAFPKSVQAFFKNKAENKLLSVLTNTFACLLLTGAQVILVRDSSNGIIGYCIFSTQTSIWKRVRMIYANLLAIIKLGFGVFWHIRLVELSKLTYNAILVPFNTRTDRKVSSKGGRINSIAINPNAQGRGTGSQLMSQVLSQLEDEQILLSVRKDNESAKQLYLNHGFQPYGRTRDLLGEWILMVRK